MSDSPGYALECNKCHELWDSNCWEKGKTYNGIDRHHNPPEFLIAEKWNGEMLSLCRKCHVELHKEIKLILNKIAKTSKFVNSEYWVLNKMNLKQKEDACKEVYEFTKKWVERNDTK